MSLSSIGRFCCVIVLMFVAQRAFAQENQDAFDAHKDPLPTTRDPIEAKEDPSNDAFAKAAPQANGPVQAVEIVIANVRGEAEGVADMAILATRVDLLSKLKQPVSFDFFEEPMSGVAEYIRENVKINVQLDGPGLDLAGITSEEPITISLSAISGEQALEQLLAAKDCTYVIRDSILLFTSMQAALEDPLTDFYDVTDLVDETSDLVSMIEQHVAPASWSTAEKPGPGKMTLVEKRMGKSCLVITQTEKNHRRCRDLLEQLRKVLQDN